MHIVFNIVKLFQYTFEDNAIVMPFAVNYHQRMDGGQLYRIQSLT